MANPTIGATTPRIQYTATASQTVFTVPFEFLANADLAVYVNGTLKTLTTDYTLTGANTTGGGSLTFVTGRTAGDIVTILGDLDYSRNTNKYTKYGLLPAEVLEADFDALQVQAKQLARDGQFALRAPLTDTATPDMVLPVKATRASKLLGFDSDGDPVASSSTVAAMDAAVTAINTIAGAAAGSSAGISHISAGTGAVVTTVQAKLREKISVKDFGAVGDGVVDDTAAIQATIDYAIYQSMTTGGKAQAVVYVPDGVYRTTRTLYLGYGDSPHSIVFQGAGKRKSTASAFGGTWIFCDFGNAPGISVTRMESPRICNMTIAGRNQTWVQSNNLGGVNPVFADLLATEWVNPDNNVIPAVNKTESSNRYCPYAGIALDPYQGAQPANPYPDITFPSWWTGSTAQYNKPSSNNLQLEEVNIFGFVVAFAISPGPLDSGGDYTKVTKCNFSYNQYGIAVCGDESRVVHVLDSIIDWCHTALVTAKYGSQTGKPHVLFTSCELGAIIQWCNVPTLSYGGPLVFDHCYGEVVYALGSCSGNIDQRAVVFRNCEVGFIGSWSVRGVPNTVFTNTGPAVIDNCTFSVGNYFCALSFKTPPKYLQFTNNYMVYDSSPEPSQSLKHALRATNGVTFGVESYNQYLASWSNNTASLLTRSWWTSLNTLCLWDRETRLTAPPSGAGIPIAYQSQSINRATFSGTITGRDITLTATGYSNWELYQYALNLGDILIDNTTGVVFVITSSNSTTVTATATNGYDSAGNMINFNAASGLFYTFPSRLFSIEMSNSPAFALYGDTTAANATMSSIGRADGVAVSLTSHVAAGDYIYNNPFYENVCNSSGSRVASVTGTSITIDGTFTRTETFRRLPLAIKKV
jgi:hypothetical protein